MSTIYYIENDENDVFLLRMAFKREGYVGFIRHFERIDDFKAAMERADSERPKAFLFDLKLNGESGLDALQWVREHPELSVIPAFLFSSGSIPDEILKSMDLEVSAYIFKPMSRAGWAEVVNYLADAAGLQKNAVFAEREKL